MMTMTSARPYLIRAMYEWITDNGLTPYISVNANYVGVQVPQEHVKDGFIVLNISPIACQGLHLGNDRIVFTARFSGISTQIAVVPIAVFAIYAKENGRGMEFAEESHEPLPPTEIGKGKSKRTGKPALTLVKKEKE